MRMVGYGRVSTDHEEQRDSLEHQQAFFQDFARARGHTLVRVYADQGISGKWLKKRDGFLQMLRDAERGEFELVVVKDISRFARNTVDSLESIRRLKALGIECIFVNNSLKVLGESEFIVTIMAAIAQEESANLSKRVKFGKDITSRKGRVPPRIYGYDRLDNFTLRIVPAEAEVVPGDLPPLPPGPGLPEDRPGSGGAGGVHQTGGQLEQPRGAPRPGKSHLLRSLCQPQIHRERLPLRPDPASPSGHALPPRQAGVGHRLP